MNPQHGLVQRVLLQGLLLALELQTVQEGETGRQPTSALQVRFLSCCLLRQISQLLPTIDAEIACGTSTQADGSCTVHLGGTKVIAVV